MTYLLLKNMGLIQQEETEPPNVRIYFQEFAMPLAVTACKSAHSTIVQALVAFSSAIFVILQADAIAFFSAHSPMPLWTNSRLTVSYFNFISIKLF